jgi:D-amino-acid dehydrogenase
MGRKSVIIVGGGVIGLFTAHYLVKRDFEVTILDEGEVPGKQSCSYANAGMIVPSHFTPLASPGVIGEGIKSLVNSHSPIGIKMSVRPEFASWMWKFYLSSRARGLDDKSALLAELNLRSRKLYIDYDKETSSSSGFKLSGIQMICLSEKTFASEAGKAENAKKVGIPCKIWDNEELNRRNPGVNATAKGAVYYPYDGIIDPGLLLSGLAAKLKSDGVRILSNHKVEGLRAQDGSIIEVYGRDFQFSSDFVVLASGFAMNRILRTLGLQIPLAGGKGISFRIDASEGIPSIPSLLQDQHIAITPYQDYVRVASGFTIQTRPDQSYSAKEDAVLRGIKMNFEGWPEVKIDKQYRWAGIRPLTPDGVPVIGMSGKFSNLLISGGHAMMGLSLAPVSGILIADMIEGKESDLRKSHLLSPERFR